MAVAEILLKLKYKVPPPFNYGMVAAAPGLLKVIFVAFLRVLPRKPAQLRAHQLRT